MFSWIIGSQCCWWCMFRLTDGRFIYKICPIFPSDIFMDVLFYYHCQEILISSKDLEVCGEHLVCPACPNIGLFVSARIQNIFILPKDYIAWQTILYLFQLLYLSFMFLTLGKVLYITEQMCQDLFAPSFASNALLSNYPGTVDLSCLCKSLSEISGKTYYLAG